METEQRSVERPNDAILERRERVADLVLNGYSERTIARRIGMSLGTVHSDIVAIRKMWATSAAASYQEHVARMAARLDQLERIVARQLAEGDLSAIDRVLKILDRRARLLGLDAPTRHDVRVDDPISAEARELAERLGVIDDPLVRRFLELDPVVIGGEVAENDD